tara:strand:- start:507 stop:869 length:363 start_codon:yes stop_codon:yes gene_type:complete
MVTKEQKIYSFKMCRMYPPDKRWTGVKLPGGGEIRVTKNKSVYTLEFLYRGVLHRKRGPAFIRWQHDRIIAEKWYKNGVVYSPSKGPYAGLAEQSYRYHREGNKVRRYHYMTGQWTDSAW